MSRQHNSGKASAAKHEEIAAKDLTAGLFRDFERLVEIIVMGRAFQVPERNTVLRCFQYLSPDTIPFGRFCWNQECQYCRIVAKLPDDAEAHEMLSCKFMVSSGLEIVDLSPELKLCLRAVLPKMRKKGHALAKK
jgi:hypothetical protein